MPEYQDQLAQFLNTSEDSPAPPSGLSHDDAAAQRQHPFIEAMAQSLGRVSDFFHSADGKQNSGGPISKLSAALPGMLGIDSAANSLHRFAMGEAHHYDSEERNAAALDYIGAVPVGVGAANLAEGGLRGALRAAEHMPAGQLNMFAGVNAATSDMGALSQAKLLVAGGKTPEEAHAATGWFKGKDGQWRHEIDDSTSSWNASKYRDQQREPEKRNFMLLRQAQDIRAQAEASGRPVAEMIALQERLQGGVRLPDALKGLAHSESADKLHEMAMAAWDKYNAPLSARLGDVLQHQRLYDAYPDLKEMPVDFNDLGPYIHGQMYTGPYGKMKINSRNGYGNSGSESHKTVLHEIQHQVQHDEGFDPGESEGAILERSHVKMLEHAKYEDTIQAAIDIRNGNQFFRQANKDAAELADDTSTPTKDLEEYLKHLKQNRPERIDPASAKEMYTASGGEVEARATEKRQKMSQIDRKKSFPMKSYDVPPDQILLRNQR